MKSPNGSLHAISPGSEAFDVTFNDKAVRTILSHPLRIDELRVEGVTGLIGITFCPGKCGESYGGFRWERDLEKDLNVIADWRADAVVPLIEDHEFELLGVSQLGEQVGARGIEWPHLPIKDVGPPDVRFNEGWVTSGPQLSGILARGGKVLLHCRGGLGRAGTVAALMLVEFDVPPKEAVARVRRARAGAIETQQKIQYVLDLAGGRNRKTGELPCIGLNG